MIPELKFNPANLKRHLAAKNKIFNRRVIYTTRDKKGEYGQVYYIEGAGYFVYIRDFRPSSRIALVETYWREEGYKSPEEFYRELCEIYPDSRELYVWRLDEVLGIEENRKPKRKTYPKIVGWFWA